MSVCLSACLLVSLSASLNSLSLCSVSPSVYVSSHLSACLSVCLSASCLLCLSVCLSPSISVSLSYRLPHCLSSSLPPRLSAPRLLLPPLSVTTDARCLIDRDPELNCLPHCVSFFPHSFWFTFRETGRGGEIRVACHRDPCAHCPPKVFLLLVSSFALSFIVSILQLLEQAALIVLGQEFFSRILPPSSLSLSLSVCAISTIRFVSNRFHLRLPLSLSALSLSFSTSLPPVGLLSSFFPHFGCNF